MDVSLMDVSLMNVNFMDVNFMDVTTCRRLPVPQAAAAGLA